MTLGKDQSLQRLVPIGERVITEGELYSASALLFNSTLSANLSVGSFLLPSLLRAMWVESLVVSSNRAVELQILIGSNASSAALQQTIRVIVAANVPLSIPVRTVVRPHQAAPAGTQLSFGGVQVKTVFDTTTTGAYIDVTVLGSAIYDDFNFSAKKVGLVIGDSILSGTGVSSKTKSMEWLTRGWFTSRGIDLRLISKTISGTTSTDHEVRRQLGAFDFPQVDYIHYQLGTNDAGQSFSASTSQANLAAMITWKQQRYPNALMVVYGSTPRQDSFETSYLVPIRAAQQAAVTAANDPRVLFTSLANAYDRTVESNYTSTDASGSKVHPNDLGHAGAYALINTFLTAQNASI